ncbi:MAG: hypothetical protein AAGG48_14610 [Planctomycetota bacterium]
MSKSESGGSIWPLLIAIGCIAYGLGLVPSNIIPIDNPVTPAPIVDEPSEELKRLVQPIVDILKTDEEKAARVASDYAGFADAMDLVAIKDVQQFGTINTAALQSLGLGFGAMIGKEVDAALAEHVGFEQGQGGYKNRALTDDDRKRIAEVYDAISWAGRQ